jgi:hypothetical protein
MAEYRNLTFGESFSYKGLIDVKGLYRLIDKWLQEHGYDKFEKWNFEEVYEDGKQITLKLHPFKKINDYVKIEIRINALLSKLKETTINQDGVKITLMKGQAKFTFDTFVVTDYEEHWSSTPFYFFLKTLIDKFIYRSYTDRYEDVLVADKDKLRREIKSFLNITRFGEV